MDLYCWLSYRTPAIAQGRTIKIRLEHLQPIFAPDIGNKDHFKARLTSDLKAIAAIYPDFRIGIEKDMLTLQKSPSPVPANITQLLC